MLDRKQLFIVGAVAVIAFIFFMMVTISAFLPRRQTDQTNQPSPTPNELLIPTASQNTTDSSSFPPTVDVQLVSVVPPDGSLDLSPVTQVEFTFTQPMNERAFYYVVSPSTQTLISSSGNSIKITPKTVWTTGKITITVYGESESTDGKQLSTPFSYSFTVKDLPFPDEEFEE